MANTFNLTSQSYGGRYMYLECSQATDIANNTSSISWKLSSIGGSNNYYTTDVTVTINGSEVYKSGKVEWNSYKFPAAKGNVSGTTSVAHDTYGNKAINVTMTVMIYDGVYQTHKGSWTLNSIPRGATITSVPASFASNGNPPTIQYSNPAGNNATTLEICIAPEGGGSIYAAYRPLSKTATSYQFTAEDMETLKAIAGKSLNIKFIIYTLIGGASFWSSLSSTFTMVEDNTTRPAVTINATPNNGPDSNPFGDLCVQGRSKLDVTISADGKYNADIKSYSASIDGKTYNSNEFTTAAIQASGVINVVGYAKDSRDFTGSATKQITVIPYSVPQITSFIAERQADGTTVIATLQGSVSPIENKNTKSFSVTLNGETQTISAGGYNINETVTFLNVPTDQTLTATARIEDWYTAAEKDTTVPTVAVTIDYHHSGAGVAFGKVAEYENLLDIAWDASIKGTLTAAHIARVDGYDDKNFNELVYNTGYYTSGATPSATGCSNYPVDVTGVLEVISQIFTNATTGNRWGFAYQTYRTYTGDIYTRSFYTDTGFTAWKKIQFV